MMFVAHILFIICLIIVMLPIIIRLLVELRDFQNKLEVIAFFCFIYLVIYGVVKCVMWLL